MDTLTTAAPTGDTTDWAKGPGTAFAQTTFGGGAFTLEATFDDGTNWLPLTDENGATVGLTAEGFISFDLPTCKVRALLTGSTGATVNFQILPR